MEVLIDTSFILSCVRKKIDFLSQLEELGFRVIVPREVIEELKDVNKNSRESKLDRTAAIIALKIVELSKVEKGRLGSNSVDEGLIKKGIEGVYIATLDRVIKRSVPNRVIISSASKSLEIERE